MVVLLWARGYGVLHLWGGVVVFFGEHGVDFDEAVDDIGEGGDALVERRFGDGFGHGLAEGFGKGDELGAEIEDGREVDFDLVRFFLQQQRQRRDTFDRGGNSPFFPP